MRKLMSMLAVAAVFAPLGQAVAADLPASSAPGHAAISACPTRETVILYDHRGYPTVPGRTPYYYCVTGTTLLPGAIPPPRQYCCA